MLSRILCFGLLGFVVALVISLGASMSQHAPKPPAVYADVTVVDVARGVDAGTLATLVRLRADERVVAVDDRAVENDFAAGAEIAARELAAGKYLDLTVAGATGARRVLVLMH